MKSHIFLFIIIYKKNYYNLLVFKFYFLLILYFLMFPNFILNLSTLLPYLMRMLVDHEEPF